MRWGNFPLRCAKLNMENVKIMCAVKFLDKGALILCSDFAEHNGFSERHDARVSGLMHTQPVKNGKNL